MLTQEIAKYLLFKYEIYLSKLKSQLSSINRIEDANHIQSIITGLYAIASTIISPNKLTQHQEFKAFINEIIAVWDLTTGSKDKLKTIVSQFCTDEETKFLNDFLHEKGLVREVLFFKNLPDPSKNQVKVKMVLGIKFPNNQIRSEFLKKVIGQEYVIYQKSQKKHLCRFYNTPTWDKNIVFMWLRSGVKSIEISCMDKKKKNRFKQALKELVNIPEDHIADKQDHDPIIRFDEDVVFRCCDFNSLLLNDYFAYSLKADLLAYNLYHAATSKKDKGSPKETSPREEPKKEESTSVSPKEARSEKIQNIQVISVDNLDFSKLNFFYSYFDSLKLSKTTNPETPDIASNYKPS